MAEAEAPTRRLNAAEAREKIAECRTMAKRAINPEHRIMLEQMAQTWERIAQGLENGH
jgi:hypothetical protein